MGASPLRSERNSAARAKEVKETIRGIVHSASRQTPWRLGYKNSVFPTENAFTSQTFLSASYELILHSSQSMLLEEFQNPNAHTISSLFTPLQKRESALNHFRCFLRHSTWGSPIEESLKDQTTNILCCSETTALPPNVSESHFRSHFTPSSLKSCIIFKAPTLREIKRREKHHLLSGKFCHYPGKE